MKSKIFTFATLLIVLGSLPARADNLDHTRQLLSTKNCPRCDLSRAGLIFADLTNANLTEANLSQANLSQANLQGADLRGANLVGVSFNSANLTGARLDGANLAGADLRGANVTGASFDGALMDGAYLQGAIGLAPTIGTGEDFYRWAIDDERKKNYLGSIRNFTQVIVRKPDFAPAYFGRSAALAQAGDVKGAIADSRKAQSLFTSQGDTKSAELASKFADVLEKPPEEPRQKPNFGGALIGILGGALQLFLTKFPIPFL